MEEQEDKLGALFKTSFEGHRAPLEEGEWDVLSNSLGKRNFFRFNPYQFNIYYASSIIACFFICIGIGSHYVYKQGVFSGTPSEMPISTTTHPALLELEKPYRRSETVAPKQVSAETENPTPTLKERGTGEDKQLSIEPMEQRENTSRRVSIKEDTVSKAIVQKPISLPSTDTSKFTKKTLYITKQDTIFKYDTVRTHKSRKKWLK